MKPKKHKRAANCERGGCAIQLFSLWNPNIGLVFRMLGILQVFPASFGAGANTQDSECMWNWRGRLFAAVFVAVIVAGFLL
jgi:hypothetical protein